MDTKIKIDNDWLWRFGVGNIKSPILIWLYRKLSVMDRDITLLRVHGTLMLTWFVFPIGVLQEIFLQWREGEPWLK